ncbi:MAG: glycosyltransferase [Bacteroidota bacterium]
MPGKKILLFGNANHQFNINYVKWLRRKYDNVEIDILSDRPAKEATHSFYDHTYEINFKSLFFRLIKQIPILGNIYSRLILISNIRDISKYDFIHIQTLNLHAAYFALFVKKYCDSRLIVSIWGSDYYTHSKKHRNIFYKSCNLADRITFTNEQTRDHFTKEFNWEKDNVSICRFGLTPLEGLKRMRHQRRKEVKRLLGWDASRIAITIGYNLSLNQQHLQILQEFTNLTEYADQIELILPITYGGNQKYKNELLSVLEGLPFRYFVYDQFLSDEAVSQIRWASDIMVQLQRTDQFSGSMLEHLFARNVVVTGSWLPYQTMINEGIKFEEIDGIHELSDVLKNVLSDYDKFYQTTVANDEVVLRLCSWENNILSWIQLYN